MTGSGLALILIPAVGTAGPVAWLIMVSSADGHPRAGWRNPADAHASTIGKTGEHLPAGGSQREPVHHHGGAPRPGTQFRATA